MKILRLYQYVNILSLDVAAGAVISSLFFARIFEVSVSPIALSALGLTVWIIYTLDHLRDAKFIQKTASTDRHRFHQKHFRAVSFVLLVVAAIDFLLIWFVPPMILKLGMGLWVVVLIYLIFQRHLKFLKEFVIACLYTAGILLPSLAAVHGNLQPLHGILIGKFFVTAFMNLLLFSLFDYAEDQSHEQHSFVTWFGPRSTRYGILSLGLINIASGIWLWSFDAGIAVIFISMNLLLLSILLLQKFFTRNNHYRIAGDAVFFIPFFYLL